MSLVDVSRDQFTRALYRRCGVGRSLSVDQVAHAIGRSARTIRGWVGGHFSPKLEDIYALCRLFGPAFTDEIMPPEARLSALQAELAQLEQRYRDERAALLTRMPRALAWMVPPEGTPPRAAEAAAPVVAERAAK